MHFDKIVPLGDQAALTYWPDEEAALHFAATVRRANPAWLIDVVQAYKSVAVFFDSTRIGYRDTAAFLANLDMESSGAIPGRLHQIPCCYELQLDLARVTEHTGLDAEQVIAWHTGTEYTVYAIGFCPGFPYLGYLPATLAGVPRLPSPRLSVPIGSIGLTGRQTGIYTESRPGGWNIIGRTPLELVNVADGYFPLRTGDRVCFVRIDEAEYARLLGAKLN